MLTEQNGSAITKIRKVSELMPGICLGYWHCPGWYFITCKDLRTIYSKNLNIEAKILGQRFVQKNLPSMSYRLGLYWGEENFWKVRKRIIEAPSCIRIFFYCHNIFFKQCATEEANNFPLSGVEKSGGFGTSIA